MVQKRWIRFSHFFPSTPRSERLKNMRERVEDSGLKIKLIEKAGRTLRDLKDIGPKKGESM